MLDCDWLNSVMNFKKWSCIYLHINSHTVPHFPVYTALFWNHATEHLNVQPLLMKAATRRYHSNNSNQHNYFNTHQW